MTFDDHGIGVIRRTAASRPGCCRGPSVAAHAVEPWSGGAIPEWWVDPELNRSEVPSGPVPHWSPTPRPPAGPRPHTESGALIVIQTATGIYRFILPGGEARELSRRVTAFAVRYHGPAAASSVTRVVAWGQDAERRKRRRPPQRPAPWDRMKPYLVWSWSCSSAPSSTLILLQSAGTIHLPFLGGSSSGVVGPPLRTR